MTNGKEIGQLVEILKQKVQAKAQKIRRYDEREAQYIQNKVLMEDTEKCYRSRCAATTDARETPSVTEVERYWNLPWREKA